jgi:hypothetical protein
MQFIKDNPENHRQETWIGIRPVCGTVACFAGHAALLSGWSAAEVALMGDDMWSAGASLLGLTSMEANTLFHPANTQPILELMVKDLVNGDRLRFYSEYQREVEQCPTSNS